MATGPEENSDTVASDVAIDPSNQFPLRRFLAVRRFPWTCTAAVPAAASRLTRRRRQLEAVDRQRIPEGTWAGRRRDRAVRSRRVYALIEAEKGGLSVRRRRRQWELATANRALRQRAWYYSTLTVHPANPNEVWFPQVPMLKTIDGGKTIQYVKGIAHGDHHDVWFDPTDPKRMIVANDGGVNVSRNGGANW